MKNNYGFSRRGPDRLAEEIVTVLSKKASYEFKALFLIVYANLRSRNAANGGEEMLRLRAYEKLQNLVQAGVVKKTAGEYTGVTAALVTFLATAAELNAKFALGTRSGPPIVSNMSSPAAPITPVKAVKVVKAKISVSSAIA